MNIPKHDLNVNKYWLSFPVENLLSWIFGICGELYEKIITDILLLAQVFWTWPGYIYC